MTDKYIEQQPGDLSGIIIDRGNSWKTTVTVNKVLTGYTIASWIKWGSNTTNLTVTETNLGGGTFDIALSASDSALITTQDNTLYVRLTYGSESRDYIKCLFKVLQ